MSIWKRSWLRSRRRRRRRARSRRGVLGWVLFSSPPGKLRVHTQMSPVWQAVSDKPSVNPRLHLMDLSLFFSLLTGRYLSQTSVTLPCFRSPLSFTCVWAVQKLSQRLFYYWNEWDTKWVGCIFPHNKEFYRYFNKRHSVHLCHNRQIGTVV